MSNVVKAIMAHDTGERKIKQKSSMFFNDVFSMQETFTDVHIHKLYKIGVHIGNTCMVSELDYMKHGLHDAIQRTKQQVIEAIFGEFRQDFRMIEKLLYNYDFEGAATALREMETKMYSVE